MPSRTPSASSTVSTASTVRRGKTAKTSAKGQQTRAHIIDVALRIAMHQGLESLSIGGLAEATQMSKSGVFAHFGSREELQISVIREYHRRFEHEVFYPSLQATRGLPRLQALFAHWVRHTAAELDSGSIHISGAVEFNDRSGPVRSALVASVQTWHAALHRAIALCQECGDLRPDTNAPQLLFEIHGLILALHYEARFLQMPDALQHALTGFENIICRYRAAAASAST